MRLYEYKMVISHQSYTPNDEKLDLLVSYDVYDIQSMHYTSVKNYLILLMVKGFRK